MSGVMQLLSVALVLALAAADGPAAQPRLRGAAPAAIVAAPPRFCTLGARVQCPGSNMPCAGDVCCPGTAASRHQSFACPSASRGFNDCGMRRHKMLDCTDPKTNLGEEENNTELLPEGAENNTEPLPQGVENSTEPLPEDVENNTEPLPAPTPALAAPRASADGPVE